MNDTPIDIVYTWVNGGDIDYQKLIKKYAKTYSDNNPERYRDIYSLLKYSLRSVEKYAHWIRDIYILTLRPQIPDWLNTSHPRIKIVHHDEIIEKQYLPTFSCNVIDSYLHKVPNDSDYLLYLNDDFLFGRECFKEDFITKDGRINIYGSLFGERLRFRIYDGRFDILSLGLIEHTPYLIYKPFWEEMLASKQDELYLTRKNKFRKAGDLSMDKLYRYYLLKNKRKNININTFLKTIKIHKFHKITNDINKQNKQLTLIKNKRPKFYCLNDDQLDNPDKNVVKIVKNFLEDYYSEPSLFEK